MAQINMPTKQQERDPLDIILKGAQIAQSLYGINADVEKLKIMKDSQAQEQMLKDAQLARANAETSKLTAENEAMSRRQSGKFMPGELAEMQKDYTFSDKPVKGGTQITKLDKLDGITIESPLYMSVRPKEQGPFDLALKGLQLQGAQMKNAEMKSQQDFNMLPKEKQIEVEALSRKIADRQQIANDIAAALEQLNDPKKSDDEKLMIGRELGKTLNSSQGADAIGAEEAKRLLGLLEYKVIPRIGEPGKAFGRDIPMFTTQVQNNYDRLKNSIATSRSQIDQMLGRPVQLGAQDTAKTMAPQQQQNPAASSQFQNTANATQTPKVTFTQDQAAAIKQSGLTAEQIRAKAAQKLQERMSQKPKGQ